MAIAARTEYFLMIDEGGKGEARRCMAGLAHIAGSEVIGQFGRNQIPAALARFAVMTTVTIR